MWGVLDQGGMAVSIISGGDMTTLWDFKESVGNQWNQEQATIQIPSTSYSDFQVVIEARPGQYNTFNAALDDLTLEEGACPSFGSCDFEDDYCIWQNVDDIRSDFKWELRRGNTASSDTGPSTDHTTGTVDGRFLFMEASYPSRIGERALLESSVFLPTPTYGLCMQFWYHMYGSDMGQLNIYANASNISTLLWTQSGNKGDQWLNARLNIKSSKSFRLSIEGVRGYGYLSDIAVDDLDFISRPCSIIPYEATPDPNLIPTTPQPISTRTFKPTTDLDCTFEQSMCGWIQKGNFDWIRVQGVSWPIESDHTLGTNLGWYLFADMSNRQPNDRAVIEGVGMRGLKCMQFYYYFFANSKFNFNVYMSRKNVNLQIWTRSGSQNNYWRLGQLTVGTNADDYTILLEVKDIVGGGSSSDKIGLDDIYFTSGACKDSSDVNKLCSFTSGDLCGYSVNSTWSDFIWSVYDPTKDYIVGPVSINDHTSGGLSSGYVYTQLSDNMRANESTTLTSQLYDVLNLTSRANDDQFRWVDLFFCLVKG